MGAIALDAIGLGSIGGPATDSGGSSSSGLSISLPIRVAVVDPHVFEYAGKSLTWSAIVNIGGVDVSARLTGRMTISGGESSARVASFSVVPESAAQAAAFELAPVTIDIAVQTPAGWAIGRRFTGTVERAPLDPLARLIELTCRDGYQERPLACKTAAEVEALFDGGASPCQAALAWSSASPDPASYFSGLLETFPGSVFIDGSGSWRAVKWNIGAARATFGAGDYFDESLAVRSVDKKDLPAAIEATMTLRYNRLHAAEMPISYAAPDYSRFALDGISWPLKSTVLQALSSLDGWHVKGDPELTGPIAGNYSVIHAGNETILTISPQVSAQTCKTLSATMYTRWYQQIDRAYTVTIDLGGANDRDASVAVSVRSEWDSNTWENGSSQTGTSAIYAANAPTTTVVKTGYEGLTLPYPPTNGALDYCPDVDPTDAVRYVAASALCRAAAGLRKRGVTFEHPIDPRFEVGDVLALTGTGFVARGQIVDFEDVLDHDSGLAVSSYTLACPAGSAGASATQISITNLPGLANTVAHSLGVITLGNWIGAASDTPANPDESTVAGWLTNVSNVGITYSPTAPVYVEQFRVLMPEVASTVRDPASEKAAVEMSYTIASGELSFTF